MSSPVNSDHRATLERIFRHPTSANIEWRQVRSLLDALGAESQEHNGKEGKRPQRCSRQIGLLGRRGCSSPVDLRAERILS
jgi:hypothetical protein